jgi:hypothetical protein
MDDMPPCCFLFPDSPLMARRSNMKPNEVNEINSFGIISRKVNVEGS